jgi:RNA polymerase sigma factor (sigma-70 family)
MPPLDPIARDLIARDLALVASVLAGVGPEAKRFLVQLDQQVRQLVRRNFPPAHREDLVNDFSQHLWEDDWRRLRQWRADAPLAHYLARLFANFQSDRMRALESQTRLEESFGDLQQVLRVGDESDRPDTVQDVRDLLDCLESGVARVTPRQRLILTLRHAEGRDYRSIGEALGVATGTVGSNLADAEKALRRRMQGECAELLEGIVGTRRTQH